MVWRGWAIARGDRAIAHTLASYPDGAWAACQSRSRSEARRWAFQAAIVHFANLGYRAVRVVARS